MREELITFESAKEKGFDIPLYKYYSNGILRYANREEGDTYQNYEHKDFDKLWDDEFQSAPTQALLQKWLRDVHNVQVIISLDLDKDNPSDRSKYTYTAEWSIPGVPYIGWYDESGQHSTYEEALEFGLQEGLKLIK